MWYYIIIVNSTNRWSVFRFCAHWRRRYLVSGGQLVDVQQVSRLRVHHEIPGAVKRFFALDAHQRQAAIVQVSGPFCGTRKTNISTGNTWNSVYLHGYTYNKHVSKILHNHFIKWVNIFCKLFVDYWLIIKNNIIIIIIITIGKRVSK